MKTSQLKQSKFLKKEDVDPPVNFTIKAVKEVNVAFEDEDPKYRWVMFFNEVEKGLVLNVENGELLEEVTGSDDSDNWIGQRIQLWANPNVKYGGKKVGGIRIRRVGGYAAHSTEEINKKFQEAGEVRREE